MSFGTVQAEKMTTESGYSLGAGNASSFKNRLINGNFLINQRNGTSAVTTGALQSGTYFSDRWYYYVDQINKMSLTQSTDAPVGFTSSNLVTVLATDSVGPEQMIRQSIEGFNIADLGWGTANAKPIVLSFWVKSSVTGTFGGSLQSNNTGLSYPFSYTINSANTWEQEFVYVTGPTTGSFGTTNNTGVVVSFEFGPGFQASPANAWIALNSTTATGASNFCSNAGATIRITGLQFEVGTVATSFDFRSIGTELALCQRYCLVWDIAVSATRMFGWNNTTTVGVVNIPIPVTLRTPPTGVTVTNASTMTYYASGGSVGVTSITLDSSQGTNTANLVVNTSGTLTVGHGSILALQATGNKIILNGMEL
jgi:hypothetical protein